MTSNLKFFYFVTSTIKKLTGTIYTVFSSVTDGSDIQIFIKTKHIRRVPYK